jgi:hypothetical protein
MKLKVDGQEVRINAFVNRIITNTVESVLLSLDDIPENPQGVIFRADPEAGVELEVDGTPVRMNAFVQRFVGNLLKGIVASLEDIPAAPGKIEAEL